MKRRLAMVVGVLAAAGLYLFGAWWRGQVAVVTGRQWERHIYLEERRHVEEWETCSRLQAGVTVVERKALTTTRRVPDGQTCTSVKGISTCRTRYRDVTETEARCFYVGDVWKQGRALRAGGSGDEPPAWPEVNLKEGDCLGCERERYRDERYAVQVDWGGNSTECVAADRSQWETQSVGHQVSLRSQSPFSRLVDCDALWREH
ncbi:MAG: hypothetical protein JNK82_41240 [Myxococcaceae bacterium]|nr:hypothetical protein [Myxococcaceae bacterium]